MIPPLYSVSLSFRINGDRPQGQKQVKKISPSSTSGATRCDRLSIFLQSLCLQISRTLQHHHPTPHAQLLILQLFYIGSGSSDSDLKPKFKTKDTNFLREPPTAIASMQAPRRFAFAQYLVRSGDETCFPSPSTALSESAGAQITCGDVGPDFNSVIGYMLNLCWLYMPDFSTVIPAHLPQLEYTATRNTRWDGVMSVFCALPVLCGVTLGFHTLQELQQDLPHPKRLVIVQSPWNSVHSLHMEPRRLSPECIVALTSLAHLTHLDTSAVIKSDVEEVLGVLLRALSAAPKLQYISIDFIHVNLLQGPRLIFLSDFETQRINPTDSTKDSCPVDRPSTIWWDSISHSARRDGTAIDSGQTVIQQRANLMMP
ncbi:hypothetical protein B0H14DRAFT_2567271 [Mycena olivaceomarginata]|nr:hypothetical protein B0H14DRAFT_2567271 [Mycena olivaceomarginata]